MRSYDILLYQNSFNYSFSFNILESNVSINNIKKRFTSK